MNPFLKNITSAEEAVSLVKSGDHVFIQTAAAAPQLLIKALVKRAADLKNVTIYHLHTEGAVPYADDQFRDSFNIHCFFVAANMRAAVQRGRAQYIPVFLSEIPALFKTGIIKIDVALLHLSPPDLHGYCSLGTSIDVSLAVLATASKVIAQINPAMPRTHGSFVHVNKIDKLIAVEDPLPECSFGAPGATDVQVAKHVASLIEDGATLQVGIGKIPNSVLSCLRGHKKLGVHTEMFSDGIIDLVNCGAITGELKKKHPGKIVAGFLLGTKRLYDFVHDNPMIEMLDAAYVNNTHIIRQNPKVCAINSAVEIDLTGQVCADSIGHKIYSGVGGQMDFMRGAALSEGGKAIIAMNSMTQKGQSKIVATLQPGAGVVTTRAHVRYVVTEYGIADLYGKTLKERARLLTDIAHPMYRESLERFNDNSC